jgi:predicted transcriptional regulator
MVKASEIMRREVISVPPEMPVDELGRFFIEHDISGAPVIDSKGNLMGIVTEYDLISQSKKFHLPSLLRIFDAVIPLEGSDAIEKEIKKMSASQVADICVKEVITIDEDTPIDEIATIMADKHITLLPVLKDGKVAGVVGKHEVIRGVAGEAPKQ